MDKRAALPRFLQKMNQELMNFGFQEEKTSGGYREAVLIDNANPSTPIIHNKNIESLKDQFNWEKL